MNKGEFLRHGSLVVTALGISYLLRFLGLSDYLFFHTVIEIFCVVVATSAFLITWNARTIIRNDFFLLIGIFFLYVGLLDFFHTISYQGIGIFPALTANEPTQLWIASRYLLGLMFLFAPLSFRRPVNHRQLLVGLSLITVLILLSIYVWGTFPQAFGPQTGLTPFKIYSEYLIMGMFGLAALLIHKNRQSINSQVVTLLLTSLAYSAGAEFLFTLYLSPFDTFNKAGHVFKLIAYVYIYRAIIGVGLTRPYVTLFRDLEQANRRKDDFIGIIGHELRTPLTSLSMYIQLLEKNCPSSDEKIGDLTQRSAFQIKRMRMLIEELLDLKRMETGNIHYNKTEFNFKEEVEKLLADLSFLTKTHIMSVEGQMPASFYGDKERLMQALSNLIINAVKYSPKAKKVELVAHNNQEEFTLNVKDFGIGIDKDGIAALFSKYHRDKNSANSTRGLGIGLYLAKQIVTAHNGSITVESKPGQGSTFTIHLPLA